MGVPKGTNLKNPKQKMDSVEERIRKKARKGRMERHCSLCKKHGGAHITHSTKE
jgi:hypothetical protein